MQQASPPVPSAAQSPDGGVFAAVLALLLLPDLGGLTDGQPRGRDCAWCGKGPLTAESAFDFGEQGSPAGTITRVRWYPRGCRSCTAERAHSALFVHAPTCEQCADEGGLCEITRALYRLVRDGRR
jgi:hypothetical protein